MSIVEAKSDVKLKINDFTSGHELRHKLNTMGVHIDDIVVKVSYNKWGPVLLRNLSNDSMRVALGRGLAEKIIVDYEN